MDRTELDATLKLAKARLRGGKADEAEAMYRHVLQSEPRCAEALHFLGVSMMQRGKLETALELIGQSVELAPDCADYHNNLATVLGRMGRGPKALAAAERAIELKPEFPEPYGNKGAVLEQLGRLDEAVEAYRQAIALRPDQPEALMNLGTALSRRGDHDEAARSVARAAELRPRSAEIRKALGNTLRRAGRSAEAVRAYRMACELNPRDADAHNNLGAALQEAGHAPEAEQALRTCLDINPNHCDAHWNLGLALLTLGRWPEGWLEYEWRQHLREDFGQKRGFPQPAWNGSPVEGRTVLLLCEQGLGDTIQFVRYAPLLASRGARVVVECQSRLRPLLQGIAGVERVVARGEPLPQFDVHARLLTLPGIFATTPQTVPADVPYLAVDEGRVDRMRRHLADISGFRVGIAWQGSTAHRGDRFRSFPLEKFRTLAAVSGVRLVSLQKGHGVEQIEAMRESLGLVEWSDAADTTGDALVDTAAVIKNLDLVITCDTAVAHLAGALGTRVWVALPFAADWRWLLDREDTPWYPTMRLFRQRSAGNWDEVFERMAVSLHDKLAGLPARQPQSACDPLALASTADLLRRIRAIDEAARNGDQLRPVRGELSDLSVRLGQIERKLQMYRESEGQISSNSLQRLSGGPPAQ